MEKFLLNCINIASFANRRGISVDHLGSASDSTGTTRQRYLIRLPSGESYRCRVRCSPKSQFNDILTIE